MIRHCVFLRLVDPPDAALDGVMTGLAALVATSPGFVAFARGANIDIEGLSPGIAYGFTCDFRDRAALDTYATNPDHQRLGSLLRQMCEKDGITVVDLVLA